MQARIKRPVWYRSAARLILCGDIWLALSSRHTEGRKDLMMTPVPWQPQRAVARNPWPQPPLAIAIGRGLLGRCPACGKSHLFNGFLRVVTACTQCGAPLGLARADDAPPYVTILITGHVIVPLLFAVDRLYDLSDFALSAIFLPLTLFVSLGLLRPVKGATVGLMLTLNMLKSDATAT